jgi:hypothetical protein
VFARGSAAAIPHLRRAIAIDPQFAMAHTDLGFFYWNMGHTDLGAEYVRKAYEKLSFDNYQPICRIRSRMRAL